MISSCFFQALLLQDILKSFSNVDVRMNFHQSVVFSKIPSILFSFGPNLSLLIVPECLINLWWCSSSSFSAFEDRRRVPSKSLLAFWKICSFCFVPSPSCLPVLRSSYHVLSRTLFRSCFSFSFLQRSLYSRSFPLSPILLNWCFFIHLQTLPVHRSSIL